MRYLSVCSGVESASVAWHDLGWTPVGFSEIEPFPSAVLAHRFPHVKNYGDMTKYKEWNLEPGTVDVLVGGTPCQSFSVAGLRKGLDDPRGNLMLVYLGLAEHLRVPWLVWENVPGVLSSNGGRDFGTFLGALGELGYRWAFRVLDAQHFGVPQRRRRVFVVAHLGDGPHPAKVLFEPESLRGDSAKGGKARQGTPRGAGKGAPSGSRPGPFWNGNDVAESLTRTSDDQRMPDKGRMQMVVQPFRMTAFGQYEDDDSGSTCKARDHKDATDLVVQPVTQLPIGLDEEQNAVVDGFGTLKARMLGAGFEGTVAVPTEDGTGRGTPIVPAVLPFDTTQITSPHNRSRPKAGDPCHPLQALAHPPAVAFSIAHGAGRIEPTIPTLTAGSGPNRHGVPAWSATQFTGLLVPPQESATAAVAFAQNTRDEVRLIGGDEQIVGALAAQPGMKQTTYLATTAVAIPILEAGARVGVSQTDPRAGMGVGQDGDPMFTLQASKQQAVGFAIHGEHSSAMTSSNPNTQVARPVETARCLDTTGGYATSQGGTLVGQEVTGTLSSRSSAAGGLGTDFEVAGGLQPMAFNGYQRTVDTVTWPLGTQDGCIGGGVGGVMAPPMAVRRLLPVECERLQGFPDDWTNIPWRGKPAPDGPRYRAMGNSMAVPVMSWIGRRLDRVAKGEL